MLYGFKQFAARDIDLANVGIVIKLFAIEGHCDPIPENMIQTPSLLCAGTIVFLYSYSYISSSFIPFSVISI